MLIYISMSDKSSTFEQEIKHNQSAERVSDEVAEIHGEHSSLEVRLRGCFITDCQLTIPGTEQKVKILYSAPDQEVPKLSASHIMSPVGPNEGLGGQHGIARWADYKEFELQDGENGEKRVSFQAKRSDTGLGIVKVFEISDSALVSNTTVFSSEEEPINTSLGEHLYFNLTNKSAEGLLINGQTLDEVLGEGALSEVMSGKSYFWESFDGNAVINFPAGYSIHINATSSDPDSLGMLVWHRAGTESICFEPTVGFNRQTGNENLTIEPYGMASLTTTIELLG